MEKLKNIISEVVNTYQVEVSLMSNRDINITHILDQVRGLNKATIVNNITPEDHFQKEKVEFTIIQVKFVTRDNPKQDLIKMKKEMLESNIEKGQYKIEGLMNAKFKLETLKRID